MHVVVFGDHLADAGEGVLVGFTRVDDDRLVEGDGSVELAFEDGLLDMVGVRWVFNIVEATFTPADTGRVGHDCYYTVMNFVRIFHGEVGMATHCKAVEIVRMDIRVGWGGEFLLIFEVLRPIKSDGFFVVVRERVGGDVDTGYDLFWKYGLHVYIDGTVGDGFIPKSL